MPRPRIIFINRVYWPSTAATAQLLTDLAESLAARHWPVEVIAAGDGASERGGVKIHRTGGSELHRGFLSRIGNYRRFRAAAQRRVAEIARPGDIVVVMTDPPLLGTAVASAAQAQGAAVVHWVQDVYPEIATKHFGAVAGWLLAPGRVQRDAAWRNAQSCVALGTEMARTLTDRGVQPTNVRIIPNWAPRELEATPSPQAVAARRAAWGVADKFVVAYSGNLGRVHEFTAVLDAARQLRDNKYISFLFIGSGARWPEVRAVAERELPNVRLLPPEPRENLAASLAAADAQLVTFNPTFDGLVYPSKLAGVLAAGRPVLFVGSPQGEIAQWIERNRCGAAFAPDGGDRLAEQIVRWSGQRDELAAIGLAARRAYESHFTFSAALAAWESLLVPGTASQVQFAMPDSPAVNRAE